MSRISPVSMPLIHQHGGYDRLSDSQLRMMALWIGCRTAILGQQGGVQVDQAPMRMEFEELR